MRITYRQARALLVALGLVVGVGQALLAYERGAAPTEVLAPLLYVPVVVGGVFAGMTGGLAAAGAASLLYSAVLFDQSGALGLRPLLTLLTTRITLYVLFGVAVALGARSIEARLRKLEIYDRIDDDTGLLNSAAFLADSDLERGRADRYRTLFSVVALRMDADTVAGRSRRRVRRMFRDLGRALQDSIRTVDKASHVHTDTDELFLVVLPETGAEGAQVFAERAERSLGRFLEGRGVHLNGHVAVDRLTYPPDVAALDAVRDEVRRADDRRRAVRAESP